LLRNQLDGSLFIPLRVVEIMMASQKARNLEIWPVAFQQVIALPAAGERVFANPSKNEKVNYNQTDVKVFQFRGRYVDGVAESPKP